MFKQALTVGPRDAALEKMLASRGLRPRPVALGDLSTIPEAASSGAELVVLDLRSTAPGPGLFSSVRKQRPRASILVLLPSLEPQIMLDAMRSGVRELLAEPLSASELDASLDRLLREQAATADKTGLVFAFLGAKGGVGTTTLAVNVATTLARVSPGDALLIDLHLSHGDASVFLGVDPRFSVVDALENTQRLDASFFRGLVTKSKAGPELLGSSDHPVVAGTSGGRVRELIDFAATLYKYVILDVPRSDAASLDALDRATAILIVANQELATVRSAGKIATTLRQRYGPERVGVVVTRYDLAADILQADVEAVTGTKVRQTVSSDYRTALRALNQGRPIVLDNHTELASSYRTLAQDLAGVVSQEATQNSAGLLGKLLGRRK